MPPRIQDGRARVRAELVCGLGARVGNSGTELTVTINGRTLDATALKAEHLEYGRRIPLAHAARALGWTAWNPT